MSLVRVPFRANHLVNAAVRTVPRVAYAAPWRDASEVERLPAVTWQALKADAEFTYQNMIATTHQISFHVSDSNFPQAEELGGEVWAALHNAPSMDLSQVDSESRILAVTGDDAPVENRTPGQHLNFYEFQFTVYITVGHANY